jgi:hypothetical protein
MEVERSEMSDTTARRDAPDDNPETRVASAEERASSDPPLGPREAFLVAYERLSLLGSAALRPAMIVVAVSGQGRVLDGRILSDRRSLVIGRHTQCALQLPDTTVSLRHIAALVRAEEGKPVLRLWDLNTGLHFTTEDGHQNAAVIASGPVYAAIGSFAIWFMPASGIGAVGWPARAQDAWSALPPRVFIDRRSASPVLQNARQSRSDRSSDPFPPPSTDGPGREEEHTAITCVAPPLLLREDDEPEVAWGELRLERGVQRQQRGVSAERLEQGILVGRYERCGLLMSAENSGISRVHLLLVRIGTEVWAIHTASTNGLCRGEIPIEAEVLGDVDALMLANEVTLRWKRAEHPEA